MTVAIRLALTCVASLLAVSAVQAQEAAQPKAKGDIVLNIRVTDVAPDAGNPIVTAAGVASGLKAEVNDDIKPTLGLTYFLSDKLAIEVIAGTTQHTVRAVGGATNVEVHKTWVLPPVVSLQYHPFPAARFSPYVGGGLNYMLFYGDKDLNGFKVKLDDGLGYALQVGADVPLSPRYSLNLDVKKVWFETDAAINGGALKSKVKLDPWVISAGLGYRF